MPTFPVYRSTYREFGTYYAKLALTNMAKTSFVLNLRFRF